MCIILLISSFPSQKKIISKLAIALCPQTKDPGVTASQSFGREAHSTRRGCEGVPAVLRAQVGLEGRLTSREYNTLPERLVARADHAPIVLHDVDWDVALLGVVAAHKEA